MSELLSSGIIPLFEKVPASIDIPRVPVGTELQIRTWRQWPGSLHYEIWTVDEENDHD